MRAPVLTVLGTAGGLKNAEIHRVVAEKSVGATHQRTHSAYPLRSLGTRCGPV